MIKSRLQDFIPFTGEIPNISTTTRMPDGTLRYSHRELITTVHVGETHFQLSLIVLHDVVDNLTLGMDFLIKAQATLVIGKRAIQFGNTMQRLNYSSSDMYPDTVTNSAHDITSVIGPPSSPVVAQTRHFHQTSSNEKKRQRARARAYIFRKNSESIEFTKHRARFSDNFKPSELQRKFSTSSSLDGVWHFTYQNRFRFTGVCNKPYARVQSCQTAGTQFLIQNQKFNITYQQWEGHLVAP
uniref:Uncharacterized protein n=1 Tax=Glossina austeni TaxID=7395 RepID=A0A1A9V1L0_GLOAU